MKPIRRALRRALKLARGQEGFWSAFFFIFLVTLGLLGLGAMSLMRSEGQNIANHLNVLQSEYALNAAAYYGLRAIELGKFTSADEAATLEIGGAVADMDTARIAGGDFVLTVDGGSGEAERQLKVRITPGLRLRDRAIVTTGTVAKVTALDSLRNPDPLKLIQRADSIPTIAEATLEAMSTAQGHDQFAANWTPPNWYPLPISSFFLADGVTPNVTHVFGNMTVSGGDDIYGIFIVEGNVTLNGGARVHGVIYLPNNTSTLIHGGGSPAASSIEGGIVSHGNITGKGSHVTVEHDPTFMYTFSHYLVYSESVRNTIIAWFYS